MIKFGHVVLGALAGGLALSPFAHARAATCEGLAGQKFAGGLVLSAERMTAGQKLSLPGAAAAYNIRSLSVPICRINALLSPEPGSDIKVEVWLPESWNGKFLGMGGGGFSGGMDLAPLQFNQWVEKGYVVAASDVGHPSTDSARFAYKQPAKLVDFAHRGNHLTAQFGKALAVGFYAKPARRSFFWGCSNGGRDALMEAWRYPEDYDGIVAGAPASPWTRVITAMAWNIRALDGPPAVQLTPAKLKLVSDAVLARCDALDGVKDGLIENPRACRFDPRGLQCKMGRSADCLSAAELTALRAIYRGPRTRDGRRVSFGPAVGGESVEWDNWITGAKAAHRQMPPEYFRWMVYGDPAWTLDRFDLDLDFAAAQRRTGAILDSDNPDLRPFLKRGGKLILYHGWADAALPPGNTVAYYETVKRRAAAAAAQVRLFMVPGMAHCGGGIGPNQVDWVGEIDRWSESGAAPERIIASKLANPLALYTGQPTKTVQTRPLCAWPRQAKWTGKGSTDEAANFRCVAAN